MSKAIIDAAASYFGMDPAQLTQGTMSTNADGLCFTFKVQCSDEDYLGIADRMRAMRGYAIGEHIPGEVDQSMQMPTLQEVMRDPVAFLARPECEDLLNRAMAMSKAVREKVEAAGVQFAETQGTGGREVKHVDAPTEEDSGLPEAVWVHGEELTVHQQAMASDVRKGVTAQGDYLVQVAILSPEQLAKVKP